MGLGKLLRVPNLQSGKFEPLVTSFTQHEEDQMKNFLKRVDRVARVSLVNCFIEHNFIFAMLVLLLS